jgi:hypothetical protein
VVRAQEAKVRVLDARVDEVRATALLNSFFWPDLTATHATPIHPTPIQGTEKRP